MRLVDVIETCSLDGVTDEIIWEIIEIYPDQEIDRLIQKFLNGIGHTHQVPGDVVYKLTGICQFYLEAELLTRRQKIYALGRIIAHWPQMNCESRALLNL